MSKRKYPRWLGTRISYSAQYEHCVLCGEPEADRRTDLQINWFRGDDIVAYLHHGCISQFRPNERAHIVYEASMKAQS